MNKILLIIKREYFSRVKKKSFLVLTFLVPVLFIGMIVGIGYLTAKQDELGDKKKIEVVDESGLFVNKLHNTGTITYSYTTQTAAAAQSTLIKDGYDYLLHIPATLTGVQVIGEKKGGIFMLSSIEHELSSVSQAHNLQIAGIDTAVLAKAQKTISIEPLEIGEKGEVKDAHTEAAYGVGILSAFLIYFSLFLYGSQVMRGVIEEKVSRIIEVVISSVKPFQLMLGKIIGVGMVGLTQFVLWIVLSVGLSTVAGTAMMHNSPMAKQQQVAMHQGSGTDTHGAVAVAPTKNDDDSAAGVMKSIQELPIVSIICYFLFYFTFGYLLYSALFAAVGSAVDSETETQQFMLPVTLPLIFTFALGQSFIVNNPDSTLSVWLSIIPFTSPIAMMIRVPFGHIPAWQLIASICSMILGFMFTTWVAARIYRVGILMYGKKASYKELVKWFFYKE